jgi:hypothetical protein
MEKIMHISKSSIARVCGAAAALFLLGCGSSGSITGDPAAAFAGAWTFGSGSIDAMCNVAIPSFPLTGDTLTITRVDPTHVATSLQGNGLMCDVNFTVTGSIATATTGQTCAVTTTVSGATVTAVIQISAWSLTVSGDTLTNSMSGTASAASGFITCTTVTADGAATRAADAGTRG